MKLLIPNSRIIHFIGILLGLAFILFCPLVIFAEEPVEDALPKGDELEEQNPIVQGVSISQLEKFCDKFSMPMYAYDKTDNLIEYYILTPVDRNLLLSTTFAFSINADFAKFPAVDFMLVSKLAFTSL